MDSLLNELSYQFLFSPFQEENVGSFYGYFDFLGEAINGTLKIADKALAGAMDSAEKPLIILMMA